MLTLRNILTTKGFYQKNIKIVKNKGRKAIAKLKANSQSGYLAMNLDRTQFKVINDLNEWNTIMVDNQYGIKNVDFINESGALMVQYSHNENFLLGNLKTNVVLAAFVTCHARLVLYAELNDFGKNGTIECSILIRFNNFRNSTR